MKMKEIIYNHMSQEILVEEDMLFAYEELEESGFDMSDSVKVSQQLQADGFFIDAEQVAFISKNRQQLNSYFEAVKESNNLFETPEQHIRKLQSEI